MRKSLIFMFFMLITLNLLASTENCRFDETEVPYELNESEKIKADILSGIWTKRTPVGNFFTSSNTTLVFNSHGLVSVVTTEKEEKSYSNLIWSLNTLQSTTTLVLENKKENSSEVFDILPTCEGMVLQNVDTKEEMHFTYQSVSKTKDFAQQQTALHGSWLCNVYPGNGKTNQNAYFQYDLNKNGTFSRTFGGNEIRKTQQQGFWQVLPNDSTLIFHCADQDGTYTTKVVKVNYLAYDELVFDNNIFCSDLETQLCQEMTAYYFNKQ